MRYTLLFIVLGSVIISCSKDKFTTVPQLEYKSVSTTVLQRQQMITFTIGVTDKEGDIAKGKLYIEKVAPCPTSSFIDSSYTLPDLSAGTDVDGDILISYANGSNFPGYQNISPRCDELNDTCYFRFILKDQAGNISDTATSETIVIIK